MFWKKRIELNQRQKYSVFSLLLFVKKDTLVQMFPVDFAKFLRTQTKHLWYLFLAFVDLSKPWEMPVRDFIWVFPPALMFTKRWTPSQIMITSLDSYVYISIWSQVGIWSQVQITFLSDSFQWLLLVSK